MKLSRFLIVLTTVNLAILVVTLVQHRPWTNEVAPVLRGRALQIVDEQGHVRASIAVMPAQMQANGEPYPETVLLRLITERGRPSVKIAASESGSGMSLAGPTGTTDTYIVIDAGQRSTSIRLRDEDGKQQLLRP